MFLIKSLSDLGKRFIKNKNNLEDKEVIPFEHLEKRDWELWLLAILIILALTLFLIVNYIEELSGSPREFFKQLISVNTYLTGVVILILMFCVYALAKNIELRRLRKAFFSQREELEQVSHTLGEVTAFLRIGSAMIAKKDLDTILEIIVQEATNYLRGNRCSIFLQSKEGGVLKTQYRYTPNPLDEQVCLLEEKEIVRQVLRQEKVSLLREPEDFADFFNYAERERKITSLMVAPLLVSEKTIGAISMALIDADHKFVEDDLDCLYAFGHQASIAMENSKRQEEICGEIGFRQRYEISGTHH
ncbi:MAG: GAF domain-containing protein [Deltaproteobacteria bacterium]|nr:GAF domain-containing protein [Deltaproteobacteria bacterium]